MFNVKCSWDVLPEGRNCFCVWSFWCSQLCSVDQTQFKEGVCWMWGSRVILPALLLTLDECSSWRVGRVVPMIRSAVRTTLCSLLRSDLIESADCWTRQLLTCRGRIQWWQSSTVSAAPVAGWTSSAGEGSPASAGPFHHGLYVIVPDWLEAFRSWEIVVPSNLNDSTAATVLFMMVRGGRAGGVLLKSTIISTVLAC